MSDYSNIEWNETEEGLKHCYPNRKRNPADYDKEEMEYFLVKEDGDVFQVWRRKVDTGGRPVGTPVHDASEIRQVAELTEADNGLSRGEIAERVGASKSWVSDMQKMLNFL